MTLNNLLSFFENYYGEEYSGTFLLAMTEYLEGKSERFYEAVAKVTIKRFSRVYNKSPDIAKLEENMYEILETIEHPRPLPDYPMRERSDEDIGAWGKLVEVINKKSATQRVLETASLRL
jgi:hypothetical protein